MSLTSELNRTGSPIIQFIRSQFPNIPKIVRAENKQAVGAEPILAPAGTAPRTLGDLGMATDYRIRFNYPEMDLDRTQALQAGLLLDQFVNTGTPLPDPTQDIYEVVPGHILHGFFSELEKFLPLARPDHGVLNPSDEATLCRYCYIMAMMEEGLRSGIIHAGLMWKPKDVAEFISKSPEWILDDIAAQNALYREVMAEFLTQPAILNPTFQGSDDVGGADADLIVGGCLIELKSSRRNLASKDIYQAIGYCLLDYEDKYGINAVSVYRSRYGINHCWEIDDFLTRAMQQPEGLPDVRDKLRQALQTQR